MQETIKTVSCVFDNWKKCSDKTAGV